jgi:type IV secretory pathway VirD2 relaxase
LAEDWRFGGSLIGETSLRREAFNIMLSMPRGTDAQLLLRAVREFAQTELPDHKYVMVLHNHQANPHVHLSVRAESRQGLRLNPRKADLQRWRESFAEKLRGWGIDAEASRQASRGQTRNYEPLWRIKAAEDGRLRTSQTRVKTGPSVQAWQAISAALAQSPDRSDRELAAAIDHFVLTPTADPQREVKPMPDLG